MDMLKNENWILRLIAIFVACLVLCSIGLYNSYPITFNNDSGVYIESGFSGTVNKSRPIVYGLFIVFTSQKYSLWLVVIAQALILALTIYYVFKYLSEQHNFLYYYLGYCILIAFFMGASFDVSWLMPDVFTSVTILALTLLVFSTKLLLRERVMVSFFLMLGIMVHNSHFFICFLLCLVLLIGFLFKCITNLYLQFNVRLKNICYALAIVILTNLISATINYHYSGKFKSSHGGPIFLMSNLVEMGIVDQYLEENCGKHNYKLCAFKNSLPNNFLWASNSPVYKTGGWEANEAEYLAIEKEILYTPKYLLRVVYKSCIYTFKQFFNYDIVDKEQPTESVKLVQHYYFPQEYQTYLLSRQSTRKLSFTFLNYSQRIVVFCCLFLFVMVMFSKRTISKELLLVCFILAAITINAWICSTFSGVFSRYQTRVVWLLPLPVFLSVEYFYRSLKAALRSARDNNMLN